MDPTLCVYFYSDLYSLNNLECLPTVYFPNTFNVCVCLTGGLYFHALHRPERHISWVGADVWTCLFIPIESADVIQKKVESRVTLEIICIASSKAIEVRQQCMIKQGSSFGFFCLLKKGGDRPLFALYVI